MSYVPAASVYKCGGFSASPFGQMCPGFKSRGSLEAAAGYRTCSRSIFSIGQPAIIASAGFSPHVLRVLLLVATWYLRPLLDSLVVGAV